jgi:hypothetical protein
MGVSILHGNITELPINMNFCGFQPTSVSVSNIYEQTDCQQQPSLPFISLVNGSGTRLLLKQQNQSMSEKQNP